MDRRSSIESSLGFIAMLGGALFPLMILLFAVQLRDSPSEPLLSTANFLVLVAVLLLLPGAVGLYLTQSSSFGGPAKGAAVALVLGLAIPVATAGVEIAVGQLSVGRTIRLVGVGLALVGSVGTGLATAYHDVLAHGRVGGALLAISLLALLGVGPGLSAVGASSDTLVALLGTGPLGLAWLVLGYDIMTRREITIEPTRIMPGGE